MGDVDTEGMMKPLHLHDQEPDRAGAPYGRHSKGELLLDTFDPWQWAGRQAFSVAAWLEGSEVHSTGLDWADAARMQITHHVFGPGRWYETPQWTLNYEKVAEVVVAYLEHRTLTHKPVKTQSLQVRFNMACERLRQQSVYLRATIEKMRQQLLIQAAERPENQVRMSELRKQICIYQTQLRLVDTAPQKLAAVIWLYFRCGLDARSVGIELGGLHHTHVRQIITRLRTRAEGLGFASRLPVARSEHRWRCRQPTQEPEKESAANHVPGLGVVEVLGKAGPDQLRIRARGREMVVHRFRLPVDLRS